MSDNVNEAGVGRNSVPGRSAGTREDAPTRSFEAAGALKIVPAVQAVLSDAFPQPSLRHFCRPMFRHKWMIVIFFAAVFGAVVAVTFLMRATYRSETKLMLRLGRENVTLDPTATTGQVIQIGQERKNEINSELEILTSRELVEQMVDSIGPEAILRPPDDVPTGEAPGGGAARDTVKETRPDGSTAMKESGGLLDWLQDLIAPLSRRERAIQKVTKTLDIEVLKDSNIISVSFDSKSPRVAHDALAKLISFYLDKHIAVNRTPGSYEFFSQQTGELRTKLSSVEEALRRLRHETGIASLDVQRTELLGRMEALRGAAQQTDAAIAASQAKVEALETTLAKLPATITSGETSGFPNQAEDLMRDDLYKLQLHEQELLSKYAEDSEPVQQVRRQIAEAKKPLEAEERSRTQVTTAVNLVYQQMQESLLAEKATRASLKAQAATLKDQSADVAKELATLVENESRVTDLEREKDIQDSLYRKYSGNLEQARSDEALDLLKISNISTVQPATYPVKPVWPKKGINLALGLFLGVFGGIGLAFIVDHFDHSLKTPEDVDEKLRLPTLVSIPRVRSSRASLRPPSVGIISGPAKGKPGATTPADWEIPKKVRPFYEALRDRVQQTKEGGKAPRMMAVTGWCRGEGTSTVAANLALMLSRHGECRVLLVDANLPHPSMHTKFGLNLSPGLAEATTDGREARSLVQPLPARNLFLLSAGTSDGDVSRIWDSERFHKLLGALKDEYSFIVFDAPALSEAGSMGLLADAMDGIILVVEAERVRWEVAQRAKERLDQAGANVLGVVLNKRRFVIPEFLYRRL